MRRPPRGKTYQSTRATATIATAIATIATVDAATIMLRWYPKAEPGQTARRGLDLYTCLLSEGIEVRKDAECPLRRCGAGDI